MDDELHYAVVSVSGMTIARFLFLTHAVSFAGASPRFKVKPLTARAIELMDHLEMEYADLDHSAN